MYFSNFTNIGSDAIDYPPSLIICFGVSQRIYRPPGQ